MRLAGFYISTFPTFLLFHFYVFTYHHSKFLKLFSLIKPVDWGILKETIVKETSTTSGLEEVMLKFDQWSLRINLTSDVLYYYIFHFNSKLVMYLCTIFLSTHLDMLGPELMVETALTSVGAASLEFFSPPGPLYFFWSRQSLYWTVLNTDGGMEVDAATTFSSSLIFFLAISWKQHYAFENEMLCLKQYLAVSVMDWMFLKTPP